MKTILPFSFYVKPKQTAHVVLAAIALFCGLRSLAQNAPPNKVQICHKGKTVIYVNQNAVKAHLAHGDKLGPCEPPVLPPCTVTATGGKLTCAKTSVTLSAASGNSDAIFTWTGPNGFTATGQNPEATVPGVYTVTVSSASCTSVSDTAMVVREAAAPVVTATGGTITCTDPSIQLTAASSTPGVSFSWTGPNGFTSNDAEAVVQEPGTYMVTATNPETGCSSTNAAVVQQDMTAPVILTIQASGSGTITCTNPSLVLTATSSSADVKYKWTGPDNFVSDSSMPVVTEAGAYQLELSSIANGCSSTASIDIMKNTTVPTEVSTTPAVLGTLTCSESSLTLSGGSATADVSYSWTGPNGFASTSRVTTATVPGVYTLRVTDNANGCGSEATVSVEQNIITPAGVTASNSEPLTCFTTEVTLMGSSSAGAVSYSWSGPEGFSSASPFATTSVGGTYTLTVTNLENGCTSTASTTVEQNTTPPADVTAQVSGMLTCNNTSVTLQAGSSTADADYNWFGPDGFFAVTPDATTEFAGEYLLMVTDRVNGCSEMMTVIVEQDLSDCTGIANRPTTLDTRGQIAAETETVELSAYPNPVRGKGTILFRIPQAGKATVVLYNAAGLQEQILFSRQAEANHQYQLPVDATRLSKGVYYCVLTVNGKQYSKKLVVMQ